MIYRRSRFIMVELFKVLILTIAGCWMHVSVISLTIRYPSSERYEGSGKAVYQPYGPARHAAAAAFSKSSKAQHSEDKSLFARYFYGMMNGTVIESGAMVCDYVHLFVRYNNYFVFSVYVFYCCQNGVKYSNSYAFYKALNWKTLNIEGNPRIYERLNKDRTDSINVLAALCSSPQKVHFIDAKRSAAVGGILEFMPDTFVQEYYGMKNFKSRRLPNSSFVYSGVEADKCNITLIDCVPFSSVLQEVGIVYADLWILVICSISSFLYLSLQLLKRIVIVLILRMSKVVSLRCFRVQISVK